MFIQNFFFHALLCVIIYFSAIICLGNTPLCIFPPAEGIDY